MRRCILFVFLFSCIAGLFAVNPSGTLPVVYITTRNQQAIDRYNPVDATLYVTAYGEFSALGTPDSQLPLTIRGRGNWTWNGFDKKPYKIVFAKGYGQKFLGMHKSRHWALMAGADDYLGFLKNTVGYSLSKHIGLPYTPEQIPVELVINGDYKGLYFVTETIRIDNDRVNIHEQQDGETDSSVITGGWLVEIDNYASDGNITFREHNGEYVMITPQSPEQLSSQQRNYITNQLNSLNDAIYNRQSGSGNNLQDILDLTDAAKFYLVQEIMEDCESYHGSCFLYKDRDTLNAMGEMVFPRWHFGPVWDFGNAFDRHQERFIYDGPSFSQIWIGQLSRNQTFNDRLMQLWYRYRLQGHSLVLADIDAFVSTISTAATRDAQRWQNTNVRTNSDMNNRKQEFLSRLEWRVNWLYSQWGEGDPSPISSSEPAFADSQQPLHDKAELRIVNGQIFIERNGKRYSLTGQPVE